MLQLLCLNWDILHSVTTLRVFFQQLTIISSGGMCTHGWICEDSQQSLSQHSAMEPKPTRFTKKKRQLHSQQSFCWISNNNQRLQTVIKLHFCVRCFESSMESKYFVSGKATTEVTNSSLNLELNLECKYEILRLLSRAVERLHTPTPLGVASRWLY